MPTQKVRGPSQIDRHKWPQAKLSTPTDRQWLNPGDVLDRGRKGKNRRRGTKPLRWMQKKRREKKRNQIGGGRKTLSTNFRGTQPENYYKDSEVRRGKTTRPWGNRKKVTEPSEKTREAKSISRASLP